MIELYNKDGKFVPTKDLKIGGNGNIEQNQITGCVIMNRKGEETPLIQFKGDGSVFVNLVNMVIIPIEEYDQSLGLELDKLKFKQNNG